MRARRLALPLGLLAALAVAALAQDPGELNQAVLQLFGAPVRATPTNGQVLTYSSTTGRWAAATPSSGMANPATADLDMADHAISEVTQIRGSNDANTGITFPGSDAVQVDVGGTTALEVNASYAFTAVPFAVPDGTLAAPSYSFTGETSLGITREAAGVLTIAKSNNPITQFSAAGVFVVPPIVVTGLATLNGGRLQSFASYTADRTVSTAEGYGASLDNAGASGEVIFSLPTAAVGKHVKVRVTAAQSLKVKAAAGDNIVMPGLGTTATAGYIQSALVGSTVCLECIDATSWVPLGAPSGIWRKDNTTSAGYAFTPLPWTTLTTITTTWTSNTTWTGIYRQDGDHVEVAIKGQLTGAPTSATLRVTAIVGAGGSLMPDETRLPFVGGHSGGSSTAKQSKVDAGGGMYVDDGTAYKGQVELYYSWADQSLYPETGGATPAVITQAAPITWANHDALNFSGSWVIVP